MTDDVKAKRMFLTSLSSDTGLDFIEAMRKRNRQATHAKYNTKRAEMRKEYDASRQSALSRSGKEINRRRRNGGYFVAVDSEGLNKGEPFFRGKGKNKEKLQDQRTCLWMAGGV
jgi:hypothetical protein